MSTSRSDDLRAKAAEAALHARQSSALATIRSLRRTEKSYLALAENEDWLDGQIETERSEPALASAASKTLPGPRTRLQSPISDDDLVFVRFHRRFR